MKLRGVLWAAIPTLGTLVQVLFVGRGPLAVLGRIRAVIVHALNGEFRCGTPSHIGKEHRKAIPPAITNDDPAPPVVLEVFGFRIAATPFHCLPDIVLRKAAATVCGKGFPTTGTLSTAARLGSPASEIAALVTPDCAAIATASPANVITGVASFHSQNFQHPESAPRQVYEAWHALKIAYTLHFRPCGVA